MTVSMVLGPRLVMDATTVLITAPTADVVTLSEAKAHLRVDHADDDGMIAAMIGAAVASLDPASNGWLGRALRPQTWELRLPFFPPEEIELPYPPLTSVTSIKYDTAAGVETTMIVNTDYRIFGLNGHHKASIAPAYNGSWPTPRDDRETVRIRYVAGYAATPTDLLPAPIKAAILLMVGDLYQFRETANEGGMAKVPMSPTVEALLANYRVY